jgi:glycosyltransferase involved in cell wall biosynthesis
MWCDARRWTATSNFGWRFARTWHTLCALLARRSLRDVIPGMIVLLDQTSLDTPARNRGHGRYVRVLAKGLSELSREELGGIELKALTKLGLDGSYEVSDDVTAFQGSADVPLPSSKDHYRWAYARRLALWRAVRAIGASAVHLGDPNATPLFVGLTRCKKVVTCHDTIPARYPARYFGIKDGGATLGLAIEKRRYRTADLVVAISEATRQDACSFLGVSPERIVRIYNGVDIDRWAMAPSLGREVLLRFGVDDRPFLLYVGASDWHKNIEGMLRGLAAAQARGTDVILAWAGQLRDDHLASVTAIANELGVGERVLFLGMVSDDELAVLYRGARAHILVSHCEGFGLPVVEAMASGCPVLTTRGGSLAEVVGDAALTVDPDDHASIGAAIARLVDNADLRQQLAERGRARAPQFSREVQARAMARAYRRLLEAGEN